MAGACDKKGDGRTCHTKRTAEIATTMRPQCCCTKPAIEGSACLCVRWQQQEDAFMGRVAGIASGHWASQRPYWQHLGISQGGTPVSRKPFVFRFLGKPIPPKFVCSGNKGRESRGQQGGRAPATGCSPLEALGFVRQRPYPQRSAGDRERRGTPLPPHVERGPRGGGGRTAREGREVGHLTTRPRPCGAPCI